MTHDCLACKTKYECPYCGTKQAWICPTLNGDEDANWCDPCYKKEAELQQKAYEES